MSKYVRTKDGRVIDNEIMCIGFAEDNILKQADTIEELIDCYAVILEHQDSPLIVYKNEIEHYKHCLVDKVKSNNRVLAIYGSIWVGVDLISKSKMNDKGELELL